MKIIALAVASSLSLIQASSNPTKLEGFRNFKFGMSLDDIKKLTEIVSEPNGNHYAKNDLQIEGVRYLVSFNFDSDGLNEVRLISAATYPQNVCKSIFDRTFAELESTYGRRAYDPVVDRTKNSSSEARAVGFRMQDESSIDLSSFYLDSGKCNTIIEYKQGKKPHNF